jgi:hypothetical protein
MNTAAAQDRKQEKESGIAYFLRQYWEARRLLAAGETFTWGLWLGKEITTAEQFHACILRGLNRKINTYGGMLLERWKWRKWDDEYQVRFRRDQQSIRARVTRRVIVTQFETDEARRRFSHLLTDPHDLA